MVDNNKKITKIEDLLNKKVSSQEGIDITEETAKEKEKIREIITKEALTEIISEKIDEGIGITATGGFSVNTASQARQQQKQVEKILESGLEEIYSELSNDKKKEFKIVGEQTAAKINLLLNKTKIKIKDIINLIKKWLLLIPGISKYFLEQEAKIKADDIIKIKKSRK